MTPAVVTVATLASALAQVTTRPVRGLPAASRGVAVTGCVPPTLSWTVMGDTSTEATDAAVAFTVTVELPVFPSTVAVIVVVPAATPVTTPPAATVAIDGALLDHDTTRPLRIFPLASRAVTLNGIARPTSTLAAAGVTCTAATGTGPTPIVPDPAIPSTVAMITAVPGASPVTNPVVETLAKPGAPLRQLTVRPVSGCPAAFLGVAVS
jgi:hypothetical protein